jgi:DNA-binding response OmpR family regulator
MAMTAEEILRQAILIVDDDLSVQQTMKEHLENAGYRVLVAADADEGLTMLRNHPIDLILLDLNLGKKSGLDFIDEMNNDAEVDHENIEVIVLTAIADPAMVGNVIGRGPTDYLIKADTSPEEIVSRVKKKLSREG